MRGRRHDDWTADGNDIPDREAFEWTRRVEGPGAALWYRGNGPWWSGRFARDDDGISVEEEQDNPASLLSFYRRLLALRRARPELLAGDQRVLPTAERNVLAILRATPEDASVLLLNLGDAAADVALDAAALPATLADRPLADLVSGAPEASLARVALPPWGVKLLGARAEPGVRE